MLIHNNSEQYSFSSKMKKLKISWQDEMYRYELPLRIMSIYYRTPDSMSDFRYLGYHGCSLSSRFLGKNQRSLTEIYQGGKNRIVAEYHP